MRVLRSLLIASEVAGVGASLSFGFGVRSSNSQGGSGSSPYNQYGLDLRGGSLGGNSCDVSGNSGFGSLWGGSESNGNCSSSSGVIARGAILANMLRQRPSQGQNGNNPLISGGGNLQCRSDMGADGSVLDQVQEACRAIGGELATGGAGWYPIFDASQGNNGNFAFGALGRDKSSGCGENLLGGGGSQMGCGMDGRDDLWRSACSERLQRGALGSMSACDRSSWGNLTGGLIGTLPGAAQNAGMEDCSNILAPSGLQRGIDRSIDLSQLNYMDRMNGLFGSGIDTAPYLGNNKCMQAGFSFGNRLIR